MDAKKIIFGLIALLLALAVFFVINFSPKPQKVNHPQNDQMQSINYDQSKGKLYYLEPKGNNLKSWDINKDQVETLIDFKSIAIDWVEYSPDNNYALAHHTNPENGVQTQTWLVDLTTKKITKELPENISVVSWRSDSQKIAYQFSDFEGTANDLVVSDPDGSNSQTITQLTEIYYQLYWVGSDKILYFPLTTELAPVNISEININDKQIKYLAQNVYIGNDNKINDQTILFQLSLAESNNFKLYKYTPNDNKFTLLDDFALARPAAIIDKDSFITPRIFKDKYSLVKFTGAKKKALKANLDKMQDISGLFYFNQAVYIASDGSLYVFHE
jgi:hypothetical protein